MTLVLGTERLVLRDVRGDDCDGFFGYMSEEDYWRQVPVEPVTPTSVKLMVQRGLADQVQDPRLRYFLAVVEKDSGTLVGEAILHVHSARWRQGEIGWAVDQRCAGRGLATEIGIALLRFGFGSLYLHRIFAQCRVENGASRRVMTKIGMQLEGILRENVLVRDARWSSAQYSILATDP